MKSRHLTYLFTFALIMLWSRLSMGGDVGRAPANFTPDDDIEVTPLEQTLWIDSAMREDDAGILKNMKEETNKWQDKKEYAENWNLESTGLYFYPKDTEQTRYVEKNMLQYFDKRLSGEVKKAESGSTLYRVGQAQKALKPSASVGVSSQIKLKFKAQVLLRQARLHVENPWVQYYIFTNTDGDLRMHMRKDINKLEMYANLDYDVDDNYWDASVSKKLYKNIYGTVLSHQKPNQMMFSGDSDKIVKINYFLNF